MLKTYFKYSWFFLIFLIASILFAYSGIHDIGSYLSQILSSVAISILSHFLVFLIANLVTSNELILRVILFTYSIILLLFCLSFYIGITNWGSPMNHSLALASLDDLDTVLGILSNNLGLFFLSVSLLLSIYFSYRINRKYLIGKINFTDKNFIMNAGVSLVLLITLTTNVKNYILPSSDKEEIFTSFFGSTAEMQRIDELKLGLDNLPTNYKKVNNFDSKNIILFSIDCLRSDHMSLNGYERKTTPFLDSIHAAGKLKKFSLSTSTCASSFCGILSMLNSKNLQGLSYFKYGLHDYLHTQGYKTHFILSGVHEGWSNIKKHYGKNVDHYIEGKDKERYNKHNDALIVDEVNSLKNSDGTPSFFFFHFMGPHTLGYKDTSFQIYKPVVEKSLIRKLKLGRSNDKNLQLMYKNNYDNGIYQSDQYIKQILNSLKEKGYLENAIVAIAGDHGESLGENSSYLGHGNALTDEYINIPILFIDDSVSAYQESNYASHIDIAPTLVSRLKLPIPDEWQGGDLTKYQTNRITYHEQTPHGFEKSHIGVFSIGQHSIQKYVLDQNSGEEIIFQQNLVNKSVDTLYLSKMLTTFFRKEVDKYKGSNYVDFKNIEEVTFTRNSTVGEISIPVDTLGKYRIPCNKFTIEDLNEVIQPNGEILKTISVNKRNNNCTCHFNWRSDQNEYIKLNLTVDLNRSVKRKLRQLIKKENYQRVKGKRYKNLLFNENENRVAWSTNGSDFIEMNIVDGELKSFDLLINLAKHFLDTDQK